MVQVKNFAVVDFETTGFGGKERICEIAIVELDIGTLDIVAEWSTLVNPQRDFGESVGIHRIDPTMVKYAPSFEEAANQIVDKLNGNILVAHNVVFENEKLKQEFNRIKVDFDSGTPQCTMKMAKAACLGLSDDQLGTVAKRLGIKFENHHAAMDDAIACVRIFRELADNLDIGNFTPMIFGNTGAINNSNVLKRESSLIKQRIGEAPKFPEKDNKVLEYLEYLDTVLYDEKLSEDEVKRLRTLAEASSLQKEDIESVHKLYMDALVEASKADGNITQIETEIMHSTANILNLDKKSIPQKTKVEPIEMGTRVCFSGRDLDKEELATVAIVKGCVVIDSVTKGGCDLLVTTDINSKSGKAKNAEKFGTKRMSVKDFKALPDIPCTNEL